MAGVKQTRDGAVGILTLNEPASLNAMTPDLLGDLAAAIGEMTADPDVRALVLTGEGRGFCSGQNLKASEALGSDIVAGVMRFYWPAFRALRECRVPVVVAVNGVAAGGGFSLAMSGDIIVAARSASFIQVFSRIGLVPDLGSTWLLPRLIGRQRALELMLLNEPLSAERAKEWGLVRQVVDDAQPARRGDASWPGASPPDRPARWSPRARCSRRASTRATPRNSAARSSCRPKFAAARMRWKAARRSWKSARRGSAVGRCRAFLLPSLRATARGGRGVNSIAP